MLVRDLDPADPEMIAGAERMNVETLADADIRLASRNQPLCGGEILRCRHLQIVLAAVDDQRRQARGLGDRGVVGQVAPEGGAVRLKNRVEMKALRRLRPPQRGPVDRLRGRRRPRPA